MIRISWIQALLCALIIASVMLLRQFVVHVVVVCSDCCAPTFVSGDRIAVVRQSWSETPPQRGEWVVFTHPEFCDSLLLGRVLCTPGDSLWFDRKGQICSYREARGFVVVPRASQHLLINSQNIRLYNQAIIQHESAKSAIVDNQLYVLGEAVDGYRFEQSYYWLMTNIPGLDSRILGLVPAGRIEGKVQCVLFGHNPDEPLWRGWRWGKKP